MQNISSNLLISDSGKESALAFTQVDDYYTDQSDLFNKALLENPYPGLRAFKTNESLVFFGREGIALKLLTRLARQRFLAILGSSGTGKSSLVRASFLPVLQALPGKYNRWKTVLFKPGKNPFGNLARALDQAQLFPGQSALDIWRVASGSSYGLERLFAALPVERDYQTLIVIDQFEELFYYKNQKGVSGLNETALFVKMLLDITQSKQEKIYVLITMRSEFLGECVQFADLVDRINEGQYLVPRLTPAQLKSTIEDPAAFVSGAVDPGFTDLLVGEIGDNMDQLPLLQHVLRRSYEIARKRLSGSTESPSGAAASPSGTAVSPSGTAVSPSGVAASPSGGTESPSGGTESPSGATVSPSGATVSPSGGTESPSGTGENLSGAGEPICVTYADYEAAGRLSGALDKDAESIYNGLAGLPRGQDYCRILFQSLTDRTTDRKGVRRPEAFSTVLAICLENEGSPFPENEARILLRKVIDRFRHDNVSFIMPSMETTLKDDTELDISHESLMRVWTRLKDWMVQEADAARLLRELIALDKRFPLEGNQLSNYAEWLETKKPGVNWAALYKPVDLDEQAYLNEFQEGKNLIRHSLKTKRRRRFRTIGLGIGIAVLALALISVAIYSVRSSALENNARMDVLELTKRDFYQAQNQLSTTAKEAFIQRLITLRYDEDDVSGYENLLSALDSASHAYQLADGDPNQAYWIASAVYTGNKDKAIDTLLTKVLNMYWLSAQRVLLSTSQEAGNKPAIACSGDGSVLAVKIADTVQIFRYAAGRVSLVAQRVARSYGFLRSLIPQAVICSKHKNIMLLSGDRLFKWDSSGNPLPVPEIQNLVPIEYSISAVALSPDEQQLAVNYNTTGLRIYRLGDGLWDSDTIPKEYIPQGFGYLNMSYAPDNRYLLLDYSTGGVTNSHLYRCVDLRTKTWLALRPTVSCAAFTPDGEHLLFGTPDTLTLSDMQGHPLRSFSDSSLKRLTSIQLSDDWTRLFLGAYRPDGSAVGYLYHGVGADSVLQLAASPQRYDRLVASAGMGDNTRLLDHDHLVSIREAGSNWVPPGVGYTVQLCIWRNDPLFSNLKDAFRQTTDVPPLNVGEKLSLELLDPDTLSREGDISAAAGCLYNLDSLSPRYNRRYCRTEARRLYGRLLTLSPASKTYMDNFRSNAFDLFSLDSDFTRMDSDFKRLVLLGEAPQALPPDPAKLSDDYGNWSYFMLMDTTTRDYNPALIAAKKGEALYPDNRFIITNEAPADLLSGRFPDAERVYATYKDSSYFSFNGRFFLRPYKVSFLEDLDMLIRRGIISPDKPVLYREAEKIRKMLSVP